MVRRCRCKPALCEVLRCWCARRCKARAEVSGCAEQQRQRQHQQQQRKWLQHRGARSEGCRHTPHVRRDRHPSHRACLGGPGASRWLCTRDPPASACCCNANPWYQAGSLPACQRRQLACAPAGAQRALSLHTAGLGCARPGGGPWSRPLHRPRASASSASATSRLRGMRQLPAASSPAGRASCSRCRALGLCTAWQAWPTPRPTPGRWS